MERVDCVVIGAGVVGLAVASHLAQAGREVCVLEAQDRIGMGISSRSSEVIHAGVYYEPGSLKAKLCVAGNRALYAYCAAQGIEHSRCGKLIVATSEPQVEQLRQLHARAEASGVHDLHWVSAEEARSLEPQIHCTAALLSPSTGILDSRGLMRALLKDFEDAGGVVALKAPVLGGHREHDRLAVEVGGNEPMTVLAKRIVNCAGLGALELARRFEGIQMDSLPAAPPRFAKGNYFSLSGPAPFSRLVYPVPSEAGLGVHLTLDLDGQARFGPDVEWIDREDYTVDPGRADRFYKEVRRYWPDLADGALQPAYAGIRPKIVSANRAAADFMIQREDSHGLPGLVNLFGIESPGLTACLALAEEAAGAGATK